MLTVDEALMCADDEYEQTAVERILAAEVRRLRDEINGLTGSLDRANAVLQNLMSYLSVSSGRTDIDPENAELRIRDGIGMLVRPAVERAELAEAQLKELANQEPLTWGTSGELMDILKTPIYARPVPAAVAVPTEWREVMAELAADLQSTCDAEHPHRDQYPSVMRKYKNDMDIVEKARALLQSAEVTNAAADRLLEGGE